MTTRLIIEIDRSNIDMTRSIPGYYTTLTEMWISRISCNHHMTDWMIIWVTIVRLIMHDSLLRRLK